MKFSISPKGRAALALLFCAALQTTAMSQELKPQALTLSTAQIHDATLRELEGEPNGGYEIVTTGGDPYLFTAPLGAADARRHYLSFEYFSATGTDHFQAFLMPPLSEANSVRVAGLAHSEGWSTFSVDVQPALQKVGDKLNMLRLDFGGAAGKTIRLRNLQLRVPTAQEQQLAARREALREAEKQREKHLREYLKKQFDCEVQNVRVDGEKITVRGKLRGAGPHFLAEVPLYEYVTELKQFPFVAPLRQETGDFSVTVERRRKSAEGSFDRLLSRWAVVRKNGALYELASHARYADEIAPRANLPEETPRTRKGLGGVHLGFPISDFDDLNIGAVTVNIVVNALMSTTPREGFSPTQYGEKTYYVNDREIARFDKLFQETARRHIVVSAIILIGQPKDAAPGSFGRLIAHPDADPSGIYAMPDVSSEAGLQAYAAIMNYLAERYSRADGRFGRIHHWILHNEVNAGWVWTNAGEKTALLYMDLYARSMRLAHLIARQYDPHAQAFISLEHHWLSPNARIYAGRECLDYLLDFSRAEGDFAWALAYHPYPQNLFNPRVWEDHEVKFSFDTPKITFKNLEVLDAWVKQPRALFNGAPRIIHLTEQGLNSPDYSEKSLRDQAAGMAYTWMKLKNLPTIKAFQYHNWVDNRGEGGLRIGLRRFPDDKEQPLGKKPIWFVYQALESDKETAAIAFAKDVTGVQNWDAVHYRGAIK